ncbi:hypothetical protein SARC_06326 [Sphaeroforma arctica JP610]|uniref:GST N-terminal domain-containing protein n=1 Tax=Sphaeroforma arctica JP610 TaxID=667725 RepID=A0A0L0FWZ2_9EUKA|nr:hypothetical protein SARC_06326 [Sphaeroforma arctica JP610]KNC81352.1 hypothetical protein SARC_06326 [Sphaeroforma arctica JP610]|eukprot:XP_014155254.1 hypothetical protein SARC_06326 [Sphaeroforma arctica JP610]
MGFLSWFSGAPIGDQSYQGEAEQVFENNDDEYVLYGSELSVYSQKVESALRFGRFNYKYETFSLSKRQAVQNRSGTHKIPQLKTPNNWIISDSTPVLKYLDGYSATPMFPTGPTGIVVYLIEEFLDEWNVRNIGCLRWANDVSAMYSVQMLVHELVSDWWPYWLFKSYIMNYLLNFGMKVNRAFGVSTESQERLCEVKARELLVHLNDQLQTTKFALGNKPCAVDASLIGWLRSCILDDPYGKSLVADLNEVRNYGQLGDDPSFWTDDGGLGKLVAFPKTTTFANYCLIQMGGAYRRFALNNRKAVNDRAKSFMSVVKREEISFKTKTYTEKSRRMLARHIDVTMANCTAAERQAIQGYPIGQSPIGPKLASIPVERFGDVGAVDRHGIFDERLCNTLEAADSYRPSSFRANFNAACPQGCSPLSKSQQGARLYSQYLNTHRFYSVDYDSAMQPASEAAVAH